MKSNGIHQCPQFKAGDKIAYRPSPGTQGWWTGHLIEPSAGGGWLFHCIETGDERITLPQYTLCHRFDKGDPVWIARDPFGYPSDIAPGIIEDRPHADSPTGNYKVRIADTSSYWGQDTEYLRPWRNGEQAPPSPWWEGAPSQLPVITPATSLHGLSSNMGWQPDNVVLLPVEQLEQVVSGFFDGPGCPSAPHSEYEVGDKIEYFVGGSWCPATVVAPHPTIPGGINVHDVPHIGPHPHTLYPEITVRRRFDPGDSVISTLASAPYAYVVCESLSCGLYRCRDKHGNERVRACSTLRPRKSQELGEDPGADDAEVLTALQEEANVDYVPAPLSANEFSPQYDFQVGDKVTRCDTHAPGVVLAVAANGVRPYCVSYIETDGTQVYGHHPGHAIKHRFDVGDAVLVAPDATPAVVSKVCSGQYDGNYYVRYPNNYEGYLSGDMLRPVRTSPIASEEGALPPIGDWVEFIAPNGARAGQMCRGQVLSTEDWLVVAELGPTDFTLWALDFVQVKRIAVLDQSWQFEYSLRNAERFAGDWVTLPHPNVYGYVLEVKSGQDVYMPRQHLRIYGGPHRGIEFWTPFRFNRCLPPPNAAAFLKGPATPQLFTPQQRALTLV